jgi:hypothetical protein
MSTGAGQVHGMKLTIIAGDILGTSFDLDERKRVWASSDVVATLQALSKIQLTLDLSVIHDNRAMVERLWLDTLSVDLKSALVPRIESGEVLLAPRALIQAVREVIEFGVEREDSVTANINDISRCVLGINHEHNRVFGDKYPGIPDVVDSSPEAIHKVLASLDGQSQSEIDQLREQFMVDEIAMSLFDRQEPIEMLLPTASDLWRRKWPDSPKTRNFGESPADVFEETLGVNYYDFLALGICILDISRDGLVRFDDADLLKMGAKGSVISFMHERLAIDLNELRSAFADERGEVETIQWLRYRIQRTPFIRLLDGSLLLIRLQYGIQRFFGDLPYWDVFVTIRVVDQPRSNRFSHAMNLVFESRVGESFTRLAAQPLGVRPMCASEETMQASWKRSKRADLPSVVDWIYADGDICLVVDANNRQVHQPFAEGSATVVNFRDDIRDNLMKKKFGKQHVSTIEHLRDTGWPVAGFQLRSETTFVPIVVVPDYGLPYTSFVDHYVSGQATSAYEALGVAVSRPAVITWMELRLLEGLAEHGNFNVARELAAWRKLAEEFPISLQAYLDLRSPIRPMSKRFLGISRRLETLLRSRSATEAVVAR